MKFKIGCKQGFNIRRVFKRIMIILFVTRIVTFFIDKNTMTSVKLEKYERTVSVSPKYQRRNQENLQATYTDVVVIGM